MSVLRRSCTTLLLAVMLTTPACAGDDPAEAERDTTTPTAPTTTTPPDPYAVPEEIDAAYVGIVMDELGRLLNEADTLAREEGEVTAEVEAIYQAVYEVGTAPSMLQSLRDLATAGFPGIKDPRGDTHITVEGIRESAPGCVVADAAVDFTDVLTEPTDPSPIIVSLRASDDADELNRTGWVIRNLGPRGQYEPEIDGCTGA